ncbi:MAG: SOS response-associated peptidase, partial [Candidatus Nanopelagicales bacterium]|nr:SOS response-associated peptidase [Candidatus Nanopelagicales bacterium]
AISFIHDRMPATISPDLWDAWLDPTIGSVEALSLMAAETDLVCRAVSRRVNSIRNNDSSLLADDPVTDTLL